MKHLGELFWCQTLKPKVEYLESCNNFDCWGRWYWFGWVKLYFQWVFTIKLYLSFRWSAFGWVLFILSKDFFVLEAKYLISICILASYHSGGIFERKDKFIYSTLSYFYCCLTSYHYFCLFCSYYFLTPSTFLSLSSFTNLLNIISSGCGFGTTQPTSCAWRCSCHRTRIPDLLTPALSVVHARRHMFCCIASKYF